MPDCPTVVPPPQAPPPSPTDEEVARYIAEACAELRGINYLLDMARLKAEKVAEEIKGFRAAI